MSHEFAPVHLRDNFTAYVKERAGAPENPESITAVSREMKRVYLGFLYDPAIVLSDQIVLIQEKQGETASANRRTVCVNLFANILGVNAYVTPNDIEKELQAYKDGANQLRPAHPPTEEETEDEVEAEVNKETLLFRIGAVRSGFSERRRILLLEEAEEFMNILSLLTEDPDRADEELHAFLNRQFELG